MMNPVTEIDMGNVIDLSLNNDAMACVSMDVMDEVDLSLNRSLPELIGAYYEYTDSLADCFDELEDSELYEAVNNPDYTALEGYLMKLDVLNLSQMYVFKYKNTNVTYDLSHLKEKVALKLEGYNGWKNYETWNVALWLGNDESLYEIARKHRTYNVLREALVEAGVWRTADGIEYDDPSLDIEELDEFLFDLS